MQDDTRNVDNDVTLLMSFAFHRFRNKSHFTYNVNQFFKPQINTFHSVQKACANKNKLLN